MIQSQQLRSADVWSLDNIYNTYVNAKYVYFKMKIQIHNGIFLRTGIEFLEIYHGRDIKVIMNEQSRWIIIDQFRRSLAHYHQSSLDWRYKPTPCSDLLLWCFSHTLTA